MKKIIFNISFSVICFSLYSQSTKQEEILTKWKQDAGCVRKIKDAKYIRDSIDWNGKTLGYITLKLGEPDLYYEQRYREINKESGITEKKSLIYLEYFCSLICEDGVRVENSDRCWISVMIASNKFYSIFVECE